MKKVVLLTGSTGFVGKQVLYALAEQNILVRQVIRAKSDVPMEHSDIIDSVVTTKDLFAESADWWGSTCRGVDTIIHLAWYVRPGKYLQSSKNADCLKGTLNLAQGAVKAGVRRFVGVGTCFEYDLTGGLLSTKTPLRPLTLYAKAKTEAYFELSELFLAAKVEFAWCRLFYLYGEGEDENRLVPLIRRKLSAGNFVELTRGNQIRDFLDVKEAGRMIVQFALNNTQGAVNVCSGVPITVRQLAEQIADEYGRRDLLRFGARPDNLVDPPCVMGVKSVLEKR